MTLRWFSLPDDVSSVLYPVSPEGRLSRPVALVRQGVAYLLGEHAREWRRVAEVPPAEARAVAERRVMAGRA